jgi:hypothetical protein
MTVEDAEPRTAREEYEMLARTLARQRALGTLSEAQDDAILERMDALWLAMSDEDLAAVDPSSRSTEENSRGS